MNLSEKIKTLSDNPGIYLFYNIKKELIYVGKATSLKNRVRSYFIGTRTSRPIEQMIHEVVDIKTIQTDSVLEAIILEANTIKKYQPKYNVDLKDDKSWNYIVITKDIYPQVETVRQHEIESQKSIKSKVYKDWKYFFGPYPGLKTVEMMKLLRKLFYISTCKPDQKKPCFYYQLGQCLGVCTGEISPMEYKRKVIQPLVKFLRGNKKSLIKDLEKKMKEASKLEDFEEARRLRDQIKNLQKIQDIALLNKNFVINNSELRTKNSELRIEGYDISNLGSTGMVGSMVVFENGEANKNEYRKFKIKKVVGQSDVDCLAEVLERRLKHASPSYQEGAGGVAESKSTPANSTGLRPPPLGKRRTFWTMPDVILVDGGKPQVSKAVETIRINKFKIPVVGIAKGRERKKNEFIIGFKDREFIKWVNEHQEVLIKVRDEAHRFAITFQKSLRKIV